MSQSYKLLKDEPCSSKKYDISINWNSCILCQTETQEPLQCPVNLKRTDISAGYEYVTDNLSRFNELGALPISLNMEQLEDGSGLEATLVNRQAVWHKSCRNKISTLNLERARKRKRDEAHKNSPIKTRSSSENRPSKQDVCIFCDSPAGISGLHKASTFDIDFWV